MLNYPLFFGADMVLQKCNTRASARSRCAWRTAFRRTDDRKRDWRLDMAGLGAGSLRAPRAIFARINVETHPNVEAEAHSIGPASACMGVAQVTYQEFAGGRAKRDEVDRLIITVRAFLRPAGAAVESRVAIARDDLDRSDRGDDLLVDEAKRLDEVGPIGRGRNF